jgi:hypothetical protein
LRERAACMLDRLHLGHDERVVRQRREWYRRLRGQAARRRAATASSTR